MKHCDCDGYFEFFSLALDFSTVETERAILRCGDERHDIRRRVSQTNETHTPRKRKRRRERDGLIES